MSIKSFFFTLITLILFVLSAGFQLFIFSALYDSGGSLYLVDPFPEMRLFEFVLASAIFTFSLIALYKFLHYLCNGKWKV